MGRFNEEMVKAGVLLAAEGIQPSSKGARIKFSRGARIVTDGPFSDKELTRSRGRVSRNVRLGRRPGHLVAFGPTERGVRLSIWASPDRRIG